MNYNLNNIPRPEYINKAIKYIDKNLIKVFTGQRRTGKSYLLQQVKDYIEREYENSNCINIDLERMQFSSLRTATDLYSYVTDRLVEGKKNFVFIDEVQEVKEFERALRSLLNEGRVDVWCTGSNAEILSGELADRLSGRYFEIRVHPLSYNEFIAFHHLPDVEDSLHKYLKFGGMPNLIHFPLEDEVIFDYLRTINATILLKDIVKRHKVRNVVILEQLIRFLSDNTGSLFSANSISKFLKSQQISISPPSLTQYIQHFLDSYYLNKVNRSDLHGKRLFEISEKYFFEDIGLRNAWVGYQPMHINKLIENVVYNHLDRQEYKISVGNAGDLEIDFIAEKFGQKIYVQCAYLIYDEKTREREFRTLLKLKDNHRKFVVTMDNPSGGNIEGIEHLHLLDFLKIINPGIPV